MEHLLGREDPVEKILGWDLVVSQNKVRDAKDIVK